jgi:hypothetical protein
MLQDVYFEDRLTARIYVNIHLPHFRELSAASMSHHVPSVNWSTNTVSINVTNLLSVRVLNAQIAREQAMKITGVLWE